MIFNMQTLGSGDAFAFIFISNATANATVYATANRTYRAKADSAGKACIAVGEAGTFTLTCGQLLAYATVPSNGGVVKQTF